MKVKCSGPHDARAGRYNLIKETVSSFNLHWIFSQVLSILPCVFPALCCKHFSVLNLFSFFARGILGISLLWSVYTSTPLKTYFIFSGFLLLENVKMIKIFCVVSVSVSFLCTNSFHTCMRTFAISKSAMVIYDLENLHIRVSSNQKTPENNSLEKTRTRLCFCLNAHICLTMESEAVRSSFPWLGSRL